MGAAAVASPALWLLVEKKPPRKQMLGSQPPPPVAVTVDALREGAREAREEPVVGTVLGWLDRSRTAVLMAASLAASILLLDPGDDEELCEPLGSGVGARLGRHGGATLHMDGDGEGVGGGDNGEV